VAGTGAPIGCGTALRLGSLPAAGFGDRTAPEVRVTGEWPFLYFGHGVLDPERIDKCEEVALWFARAPTLSERKRIVVGCPPPLASFQWGDVFVYFGSPGDSYDGLVCETYGSPAFKAAMRSLERDFEGFDGSTLPDPGDELPACVEPFAADVDRWLADVHAIVPIRFFLGPHGAEEDDPWNRWSEAHAGEAFQLVTAHEAAEPWLAKGEAAGSAKVAPAPESGRPKAPKVSGLEVAAIPRSEAARYFGYIRDRVLRLGFSGGDDQAKRAILETLYGADGITSPPSRLSLEEHRLQTNAGLVDEYLGKGKARRARLAALSPWVRLAWLASYTANRGKDLVGHPDPVGLVRDTLEALPAERAAAGTALTVWIANHLCHIGPGFSKVDRKHADLASRILEGVLDRADAPAEAFLHAATFAEWAGRDEDTLALGTRGIARFPRDRSLLSGAIAAAGRLGRTERVAEWSARLDQLPPDHDTILNQTFALVKAGKNDKALEALDRYVAAGGALTAKILTNFTYCIRFADPTPARAASALDRVEAAFAADPTLLLDAALIENAVAAMNTRGRASESIDLAERANDAGLPWTATLACNTSYSAVLTRDAETGRRVATRISAAVEDNPSLIQEEPGTLDNLGCLWGLAGDLDRGFVALRAYVAARTPDWNDWETSADYAAFRGDPRWAALRTGKENRR
jgi:hypothetical protein